MDFKSAIQCSGMEEIPLAAPKSMPKANPRAQLSPPAMAFSISAALGITPVF